MNFIRVNLLVLISNWISTFSLRMAFASLFESLISFYISFGFFRVYGLRNKEIIKKVFGSNPNVSFLNNNFSSAHGMRSTIDTVDASDTSDRKWNIIHKSVKSAIIDMGDIPIQNLCNMFEKRVQDSFSEEKDILIFMDEIIKDWFFNEFVTTEYSESEKENFYRIRTELLASLRFAFYDNRFRWVPLIGNLTTKLYRRFSGIEQVKTDFFRYIIHKGSEKTFLSYFRKRIFENTEEVYSDISSTERVNIFTEIYLNNSLLMVLVYDFLHTMIMGTIIQKIDNLQERGESTILDSDISGIYRDNFLFPLRARTLTQDITIDNHCIPKGSVVIADLVESNLFYSFGRRSCAGQSLARPLIKGFIETLNRTEILLTRNKNNNDFDIDIQRTSDPDIPIVNMNSSVAKGYLYYRDSLQRSELIPSNNKLKNLWHLYSNRNLQKMIRIWVDNISVVNLISNSDNMTVIAPEARALPFAAMFGLPIITITKEDKFGPTRSVEYTRGYNSDAKKIHLYDTMKDYVKGNIILVDDGIASGGTLVATMELLPDIENENLMIIAIINHTYTERSIELSDSSIITMFDF